MLIFNTYAWYLKTMRTYAYFVVSRLWRGSEIKVQQTWSFNLGVYIALLIH